MMVVVACIVVFFAMIVDLASGLMKAKQRGEVRTSYGLSRSLFKFVMYEGGLLIATGIDILIYFSKLLQLFNLQTLKDVPFITCIIGIFLLVTELISIREKADEKADKNFKKTAELLQSLFTKEELKELIKKKIENKEKANE